MKTLYYLKSCDTCRRIMENLNLTDVNLREIKTEPLTEEEVDRLAAKAGSYEAIFNKRARKLRDLKPDEKPVDEAGYRRLLLAGYTFLKRPVYEDPDRVWVGKEVKSRPD